ncbi:hypothetical protein RchiOBHm_Chr6g0269831 [Rosa chinensis]|uniref:Uncharacterized protein n=1 Tax=Rosa chinensis TaxID=74649 RepID=A0A2P6PQK7_ROSCH|nr:hypothetical protein RchiOBHm_Chr6g0269831 [Rosa chinensis]
MRSSKLLLCKIDSAEALRKNTEGLNENFELSILPSFFPKNHTEPSRLISSFHFRCDCSLSIVLLCCSFLCRQIPNLNPHRHKLGEKPSTSPPFVFEKHHQKYERSYF